MRARTLEREKWSASIEMNGVLFDDFAVSAFAMHVKRRCSLLRADRADAGDTEYGTEGANYEYKVYHIHGPEVWNIK